MNPGYGKHLCLISLTTSSIMFECISSNLPLEILGIWLLLTGVIGFFAMGIDKARATYGEWRISEKTLFTMALVGGFWGVVLTSLALHHQSSKLSLPLLAYGISALLVLLLF